jgi:3-oxoacyl-[acyl-carrier protein] reductase
MPDTDVLSLTGRVAVVTGAGRGIGAATARLLAQAGAQVALVDRDAAGVTQTVEQIGVAGGEALHFTNDVTDSFAVERTFDRVAEEWGRLDVLVNNAGTLREAPLEDLTDDDFRDTLDVNLRAAMVCARAALPHMLRQGRGRILSAASGSTRLGSQGLTAYAAAKAGIVGMTRTWARELGRYKIRVNAVAPGYVKTEILSTMPQKILDAMVEHTPLGRIGSTEDVANAYLWLASDQASFVTGHCLSVDGGVVVGT